MGCHEPFTGEFFHAIDTKSRLTIPAKLRDAIRPREQTAAFYAVAEYDRALCLYTPQEYRERAPQFGPSDLADEDVRNFQRLYFAMSEYLEVDRLGRVLLPERLLARCGITKNVAIIGAADHIEVWDETRWREWVEKLFPSRDQLAVRVAGRAAARPEAPAPDEAAAPEAAP